MADIRPYRSTPVFDQDTLPAALRARHDTKAGVWGLIRVIEGELKLTYLDPPSEVVLTPGNPGLILPQQPHYVTPLGPMKMRVDFYDQTAGDGRANSFPRSLLQSQALSMTQTFSLLGRASCRDRVCPDGETWVA